MLEKREKPKLGGGPFGLGDPDDKSLRNLEKDVIIDKMLREEAQKRCDSTYKMFLTCAADAGLRVIWKCQEENTRNNECLVKWLKDPKFIEEVTNKYLEARSHYRRTGEPLQKYERKKSPKLGFC